MKPELKILVGPPLSGKDTYLREHKFDSEIISRDDILMSLVDHDDYSLAFKTVNQSLVDKLLKEKLENAIKNNKDVIINMTNLSKKGRRRFLLQFPNSYTKTAVVFPKLELEEYIQRNLKRQTEENKFIPIGVIQDMLSRWEEVSYDEGFDKIIKL